MDGFIPVLNLLCMMITGGILTSMICEGLPILVTDLKNENAYIGGKAEFACSVHVTNETHPDIFWQVTNQRKESYTFNAFPNRIVWIKNAFPMETHGFYSVSDDVTDAKDPSLMFLYLHIADVTEDDGKFALSLMHIVDGSFQRLSSVVKLIIVPPPSSTPKSTTEENTPVAWLTTSDLVSMATNTLTSMVDGVTRTTSGVPVARSQNYTGIIIGGGAAFLLLLVIGVILFCYWCFKKCDMDDDDKEIFDIESFGLRNDDSKGVNNPAFMVKSQPYEEVSMVCMSSLPTEDDNSKDLNQTQNENISPVVKIASTDAPNISTETVTDNQDLAIPAPEDNQREPETVYPNIATPASEDSKKQCDDMNSSLEEIESANTVNTIMVSETEETNVPSYPISSNEISYDGDSISKPCESVDIVDVNPTPDSKDKDISVLDVDSEIPTQSALPDVNVGSQKSVSFDIHGVKSVPGMDDEDLENTPDVKVSVSRAQSDSNNASVPSEYVTGVDDIESQKEMEYEIADIDVIDDLNMEPPTSNDMPDESKASLKDVEFMTESKGQRRDMIYGSQEPGVDDDLDPKNQEATAVNVDEKTYEQTCDDKNIVAYGRVVPEIIVDNEDDDDDVNSSSTDDDDDHDDDHLDDDDDDEDGAEESSWI